VADWLARVVGWSPLGRTIALHGAEGPFAAHFNGRVGNVVAIEGQVIVVDEVRSQVTQHSAVTHLRLTPRHAGWTGKSLMLTPIAVVAEVRTPGGRDAPTAIAIARILRI
jgi:hypothetical protein